MARRIWSQYALDVFESGHRRTKNFTRYLNIYLDNIAPENRTDTNQMLAFFDDPFNDRRVIYFGLLHAGVPCGFAMFLYYPKDGIAVVDHLAIDLKVRGGGAFYAFVELITDFLARESINPDYVAVEILRRTQSIQGEVNPVQLIRLLRFIGFRVLRIPYIAPHPGIIQNPDRFRSALMLICKQPINELPADECKRIVEVIYYNHYLKWYQRALKPQPLSEYRTALERSLENIVGKLPMLELVKLNGANAPSDEVIMQGGSTTSHISDFTYAAFVLAPIVLTVALAFAQLLWLTAIALIGTLVFLALVFAIPSWRARVIEFFRPK
jgi:hypothetical protein